MFGWLLWMGKLREGVWNFHLFPFQTHALSLNATDFKILTLQTLLVHSKNSYVFHIAEPQQ